MKNSLARTALSVALTLLLVFPAGATGLSSISDLKEQIEQLLLVERNPNTPAEVRDFNRTFLAERRSQLRDALQTRINALRKYQTSVGSALLANENEAISNSIRELEKELKALPPATDAGNAPAASVGKPVAARARRVGLAGPASPAVTLLKTSAPADDSPATEAAGAESFNSAPPPQAVPLVRINSPAADGVEVATLEYQVEVEAVDPKIDSLMVSAYNPPDAAKPYAARMHEFKRSEGGKWQVVIELRKGANLIVVNDPKDATKKATRTILYAPPSDDQSPLGASNLAEVPAATPDPSKTTICGQVTLASLGQTLALIKTAPDPKFKELAERFRPHGEVMADIRNFTDKSVLDPVIISSLNNDCTRNHLIPGRQKDAVVGVLKDIEKGVKENSLSLQGYSSQLSLTTIQKQIVMLEQYLGNVIVHVRRASDNELIATPMLDRDGNFSVQVDPAVEYIISTEGDDHQTKRRIKASAGVVRVNLEIEDRPVSLLTRAVVGYEQAGAAAAKREQTYFFDLFISHTFPITQRIHPDFGERLRTWGDIRFVSVPQSGTGTIGELATGLATNISGLAVKDAANVFDFQAGLEFQLTGNNSLLPSFDRRTKQKLSLSLIGSFGAITPTNPEQSISVFKVFRDAPGLPASAKDKEFVAFIASDRNRFFRQYFAGIRTNLFFFNKHNVPMQRFPSQLDVTIGQSEFVSGGKLHGAVMRFDGYFPLPYDDLQFINIHGTALMHFGRATTGIPLLLESAPAGTIVPGANVALVEVRQLERDYYRAGVGIDFISFVKKFTEALSKTK